MMQPPAIGSDCMDRHLPFRNSWQTMKNKKSATVGPDPLPADALYRRCDPSLLPFTTTAEAGDGPAMVGQARALAALEFGITIASDGYNLFVLGRSGSHRRRIVEDFLAAAAAHAPPPDDWCYLNDFADDRKPIAMPLPAGRGAALREDMHRLIEELRVAIPTAFESEHYRNSIAEINQEFEDRHRKTLDRLQEEANAQDVSLVTTPHGFSIAPTRAGRLLEDEEFAKLSEDEKKRAQDAMARMSDKLRQHIEELPQWHAERRDQIKALNREVTELAAGRLIAQLAERYRDIAGLVEWFDAVRENVLENARDFLPRDERAPGGSDPALTNPLERYAVNLLVDHAGADRPPIVYESHPSLPNLLGRIEHLAQFGTLVTNFSMIRAGALHRANGGYLVLDAERLLTEPLAWNAMKRALYAKEIRIESLGQMLNLVSTVSLEPEPIPLNVKVILVGERLVYYLLCEYDPDFGELFKVAADFESRIERDDASTRLYGQLVATLARNSGLKPFDRNAVARVIEHSARLAEDSGKLTTRLRDVSDLLQEADYWAGKDSAAVASADHVQKAIDAQIHRLDRARAQTLEEIERNSILIDTDGARIGQVNGLSVIELGSFRFGQPSRITANVRLGEGEIVDIERETELGGAIHSKGVLILASWLSARYSGEMPLSVSASLVFEQSYGGVEGDSASIAEACALISALARLPIRQSLAVTGSMNQHGAVQVIGGVNEKIEGFFDICRMRGLTGDQGVLIPHDNQRHLMLRPEVVEAVRAGRFHVYSVRHVDDAITLLTGVEAGRRTRSGSFPRGTVNLTVQKRLKALAEKRRAFDSHDKKKARKKKTGAD
jgi:lon-related putative ATP-dependent protease